MGHSGEYEASSRAAPRTRVLLRALLILPDRSVSVRLRDVSREGARLYCDEPISYSGDVLLKRGGSSAAARIIWTEAREAGIEFYRTMSSSDVAQLLNPTDKEQVPASESSAPL